MAGCSSPAAPGPPLRRVPDQVILVSRRSLPPRCCIHRLMAGMRSKVCSEQAGAMWDARALQRVACSKRKILRGDRQDDRELQSLESLFEDQLPGAALCLGSVKQQKAPAHDTCHVPDECHVGLVRWKSKLISVAGQLDQENPKLPLLRPFRNEEPDALGASFRRGGPCDGSPHAGCCPRHAPAFYLRQVAAQVRLQRLHHTALCKASRTDLQLPVGDLLILGHVSSRALPRELKLVPQLGKDHDVVGRVDRLQASPASALHLIISAWLPLAAVSVHAACCTSPGHWGALPL